MHVASTSGDPRSTAARPSGTRRLVLKRAAVAGAASLGMSAKAAPGVAGDLIRFGQSAPVTGVAQLWGIEYQRGIRLAFVEANAEGGVGGRRLELVTYDDLFEPTAAESNTAELIDKEHVFALIGYVGADAVARSLPLAATANVPFIAPLTGDETLRRDAPRCLFNLRAGYDSETQVIARALATISFGRIVVLRPTDGDGDAALKSLQHALAAAGLPAPLDVVPVGRNSTAKIEFSQDDIGPVVNRIVAATPQAVVFLTAYATTAAVVKQLRQRGFAGGCYATSLSSVAAIGPLLGRYAAGLSITQVTPSPFDSSWPLVAAYQRRLAASCTAPPEYASLEGWIAGSLVVLALRRMGPAASRDGLETALESLSTREMDGLRLQWDAARRQFRSRVTLTVLDERGRPRA